MNVVVNKLMGIHVVVNELMVVYESLMHILVANVFHEIIASVKNLSVVDKCSY